MSKTILKLLTSTPRKLSQFLQEHTAILWLCIAVTLLLAIFPDAILFFLQFIYPEITDAVQVKRLERIFAGANALLLSLSTGALVSSLKKSPTPSAADAFALYENTPNTSATLYREMLVFCPGLLGTGSQTAAEQLETMIIYANASPRFEHTLKKAKARIQGHHVVAILTHKRYFDEFIALAHRSQAQIFLITFGNALDLLPRGPRTDVVLPSRELSNNEIRKCSNAFLHSFHLDTPRYLGFHGTWCGTYGILAIRQKDLHRVEGWFYYGNGKLEGETEISNDRRSLILNFSWTQGDNATETGSEASGHGCFTLPNGFESLMGYWYFGDDLSSAQIWNASRLSGDIIESLNQGGEYARDFGVSQHGVHKIVSQ